MLFWCLKNKHISANFSHPLLWDCKNSARTYNIDIAKNICTKTDYTSRSTVCIYLRLPTNQPFEVVLLSIWPSLLVSIYDTWWLGRDGRGRPRDNLLCTTHTSHLVRAFDFFRCVISELQTQNISFMKAKVNTTYWCWCRYLFVFMCFERGCCFTHL